MQTEPLVYDIEWWESKRYDELREQFEWELPESLNMGVACADAHADTDRTALVFDVGGETVRRYSFTDLERLSNRLANHYRTNGVEEGDVVAVCLPQCPQNIVAHLAAWKAGAVSMPLTLQFGPRALSYRVETSDAACVVVDDSKRAEFENLQAECDHLESVVLVEPESTPGREFDDPVADQDEEFDPVETTPDDPAMVIFSSGTTGDPKGIVHGHRILLATLPAFLMCWNDLSLDAEDVFWTPAAWAWGGSLLNYVFPPLFYGNIVIADYRDSGFDPERGYRTIEQYGVSKAFLPPTALRMMMSVDDPTGRFDLESLSVIGSGGELLGEGPYNWVQEHFEDVTINEVYGQTEAHAILGSCTELYETSPGSVGKPVVGHDVEIRDDDGGPVPTGEEGQVAVRVEDDPVVMLHFLGRRNSKANRIRDGWWLTGDLGKMDEDGYFTIVGRQDDIIISSGYRIGPEQVEDVLCEVSEVQNCAVVGAPDEVRGEIVKAYVQLESDVKGNDVLVERLQEHARSTLAMYEYPRQIEFVDSLPTTASGKIQRFKLREDA